MEWWSWVLSAVGLTSLWLLGNKSKWGFAVGLLADVLWCSYSINTQQWGFVPGCIVYASVHIRSFKKWKAVDDNSQNLDRS